VKIGHSTVIQATDGNLWVTNPNAQLWGTEWLGHTNIATTRIYDRRKMKPEDSPTSKVCY